MGFLDKLLGRNRSEKITIKSSMPEPEQPIQPIQSIKPKLDLSKRIGLNFEKMNLNDPDTIKKRVFLLDVSGSMGDSVDGKKKILHLRNVMEKYPNARMMCFSSNISMIHDAWSIPDPQDTTNLAKALRHVLLEKGSPPERLVLVSDGEPDSEIDALEVAKQLKVPIDIIFIGHKGSRGDLFMEKLARHTGGQNFIV